jgi:hypothetical protein
MQTLDRILALTESVEEHVARGEWTQAGVIDAERCRLLAALFAENGSGPALAAHREVLEQLLVRNMRTIEQVEKHKRALALESAGVRRARGALHAYRRNSGPVAAILPDDSSAVNAHEPTEQQ